MLLRCGHHVAQRELPLVPVGVREDSAPHVDVVEAVLAAGRGLRDATDNRGPILDQPVATSQSA